MTTGVIVATSRNFQLRPLERDDLDTVAAWLAGTDEYLGADAHFGSADLATALEWSRDEPTVAAWAIEDRAGALAGMASWRPDFPWLWVRELEGMLGPDLRGRGLGVEASALVIEHLFATTDAAKMLLRVSARNRKAFPMLRHLGWHEEGRLRKQLRIGGEDVDLFIFGLLREEWERAHARQRLLSLSGH